MAESVRVRIASREAPAEWQGERTEFGLQDKNKVLHAGRRDGGHLVFEAEITAREDPKRPGMARFGGPFVHGSPEQHLYVGWRQADSEGWINRLKVTLEIQWAVVQQAAALGAVLETDATGPEWGVLKNWHGLGMGRTWAIHK